MRVFLTGSSGYLGRHIAKAFMAAGHNVIGLSRSGTTVPSDPKSGSIKVANYDIRNFTSYQQLASCSDVVVHTASDYSETWSATERDFLSRVMGLPNADSRLIIYTSGTWVFGNTNEPFGQLPDSECVPPAVRWRASVEHWLHDATHKECSVKVVRPALMFGGIGGLLESICRPMAGGSASRVIGDGRNNWALVNVNSVASLFVSIAEKGKKSQFATNANYGCCHDANAVASAINRFYGGSGKTRNISLPMAHKIFGELALMLTLDQRVAIKSGNASSPCPAGEDCALKYFAAPFFDH